MTCGEKDKNKKGDIVLFAEAFHPFMFTRRMH